MIEAVNNSPDSRLVTIGPYAFASLFTASGSSKKFFSFGFGFFPRPAFPVLDLADDLVMILIPFIDCPESAAIGAFEQTLPISHIQLLESLLKTIWCILNKECIIKAVALAWHRG